MLNHDSLEWDWVFIESKLVDLANDLHRSATINPELSVAVLELRRLKREFNAVMSRVVHQTTPQTICQ